MITVITGMICFSAGLFLGMFYKTMAFESQDWKVMKWNKDVMGYRPIIPGSRLFKGDKIAMSLSVDTSKIPREGVKYEE